MSAPTASHVQDLEYLLHALQLSQIPGQPLYDCIVRSWDFEKFLHGERPVTEIGVADFDTRDIKNNPDPGPHGINWLRQMKAWHFRIREEGHKQNRAPFSQAASTGAYNQGDNFDFGRSEWIRHNQVPQLLQNLFQMNDPQNPGKFRKIVLLQHAGNNELYTVQSKYNVRLADYDTVDRTTDIQHLTVRLFKLWHQTPALNTIMENMGWPLNHANIRQHNGGNDSAFQLMLGIQICLAYNRFQRNIRPMIPGGNPTPLDVLRQVQIQVSSHPQPAQVGNFTHCLKCGEHNHNKAQCTKNVRCHKCLAHGSHATDVCHVPDIEGRLAEKWVNNIARNTMWHVQTNQDPFRYIMEHAHYLTEQDYQTLIWQVLPQGMGYRYPQVNPNPRPGPAVPPPTAPAPAARAAPAQMGYYDVNGTWYPLQ